MKIEVDAEPKFDGAELAPTTMSMTATSLASSPCSRRTLAGLRRRKRSDASPLQDEIYVDLDSDEDK
jgi:hypothetical protein